MEKSQSIVNIAKSLIEFQKKVGKIKKDSINPFLNKKYASLSNILDQVQGPLTECGLAISQFPDGDAGLVSILMHGESGEYMQQSCEIKSLKEDPQVRGSHISYLRRYALCSILCLNIDDDDDATAKPGGAQQQRQGSGLPWLNKGVEYEAIVKELEAGTMTIPKIKEKFKVSKATEEEFKVIAFNGLKKRVESSKDINELTALYNEAKDQVDSSEEVKGWFQKRKKGLTTTEK